MRGKRAEPTTAKPHRPQLRPSPGDWGLFVFTMTQLHELRLKRAEANLCDVQRQLPKDALVISTRYTNTESVTLYRGAAVSQSVAEGKLLEQIFNTTQ